MKITVWNISFCIVLFILHRFLDLILGFVPGFAAVAVDLQYAAVLVLVAEVEATVAVPVELLTVAGGLLDNGSGRDEAEDSVRKQTQRHSVCSELCCVADSGCFGIDS